MSQSTEIKEEEMATSVENVPGWTTIEGPKLQRRFEFRDFVEAFAFMTKVALIAESMDHHPDWTNVYNVVTVTLYKHDTAIISAKDFDLARKINTLFNEY